MKWKEIDPPFTEAKGIMQSFISDTKLFVLRTPAALQDDGKFWQHISLSRKDKMPTYADMVAVKQKFIGDEFEAIQVFPKAEKHVNIHNFCLHLWVPINHSPLPDFTMGTGMI